MLCILCPRPYSRLHTHWALLPGAAEREIEATDMTALDAVMSVNEEKTRLEAKVEKLNTMEGPEVEQLLIDIYERCIFAFKYTLGKTICLKMMQGS